MSYQTHELELGFNQIYLLEFDENFIADHHLDTLTKNELIRFEQFNNVKRQKEFVATRLLFHKILGYQEIKYEEHGAPYISDHDYISISHAQNLVGFARNPNYPVGFDIELIHPKVLALHEKFLNQSEQNTFDLTNTEELIACWSMKETMYKMAGRKEILFKEELLLSRNKDMNIQGKICNKGEEIFVDLQTTLFKNFILSTNSSAPRYVKRNTSV